MSVDEELARPFGPMLPFNDEAIAAQAKHVTIVSKLFPRLEQANTEHAKWCRALSVLQELMDAESRRWSAEMRAAMPELEAISDFRVSNDGKGYHLFIDNTAVPQPPQWVLDMMREDDKPK